MLKDISKKVASSEYNSASLIITGSTIAAVATQSYGLYAAFAGVAGGCVGLLAGRIVDGVSEYILERHIASQAANNKPSLDSL